MLLYYVAVRVRVRRLYQRLRLNRHPHGATHSRASWVSCVVRVSRLVSLAPDMEGISENAKTQHGGGPRTPTGGSTARRSVSRTATHNLANLSGMNNSRRGSPEGNPTPRPGGAPVGPAQRDIGGVPEQADPGLKAPPGFKVFIGEKDNSAFSLNPFYFFQLSLAPLYTSACGSRCPRDSGPPTRGRPSNRRQPCPGRVELQADTYIRGGSKG